METSRYRGGCDWLVLFGIGDQRHDVARRQQISRGGRVLHWDLGYTGLRKGEGHLRVCIDTDHPQALLERTPPDPSRWDALGIELRNDVDEDGPVILVGLGKKSRSYLNAAHWEARKLRELQKRFTGRRIVFRPKGEEKLQLPCESDSRELIADVLRGASLVVCRHSNVAVDATIAGVPFEAEDGAAMWLQSREFTPANRLEFLQRLAWWQWRADEAAEAWAFAKRMANT
uniref:Uncharacterized protein n=1 Tax=Variovorax sp. HH01 TaxID=1084736 RepID=I3PCP2_9BURK|nr:hypothetical protein var072 [Variovorax sp. HH01]